ncbi:MAG: sugar-transfer associated ATP-grasp domain-containing protein [Bacteroidota bacterium]
MNVFQRITQIRERVVGMNERNINLIYPYNAKSDYKYADDKYMAKMLMEKHQVACPKTYTVVDQIGQIDIAWQAVREWKELVIKPAKGAGGKGIMILRQGNGVWLEAGAQVSEEQIFTHIANIIFGVYSFGDSDVALVEEYIHPHPFFHKLYPKGVPDIRIILLKSVPLLGMLRMPTAASNGKANLHQGGLGIGIEMDTGCLKEAYNGKAHIDHHPDSNRCIPGLIIPYWEELMALAVAASKCFPLNYMGVDLVIDKTKGPMVMEVNVRPGLGIQLANKQGLKQVIDKIMMKEK